MATPPRYVPIDEYMDMVKHIQAAIAALAEATDALRTVTLLTASALAKQKHIDTRQFMTDVSNLIEGHYPQGTSIPMPVLDFRAELAHRLTTKE